MMQREPAWEQVLHNLERTDLRRDWRFARQHVVGLELDDVGPRTRPDPGYESRAESFLQREEELLREYFSAPKGRRRRRLEQRITSALVDDDLVDREVVDRLIRRRRRSRFPRNRAR